MKESLWTSNGLLLAAKRPAIFVNVHSCPKCQKELELRLTCSSKESDAARRRAFAFLSGTARVALLVVGLSGGESSVVGVVLVSGVARNSVSKTDSST